ncbi:hypothetical protein [Vibrio harveyi]|uniref:hypothetical protein n=1 Tax=Vibrio harveyi TaxID=669 RepID=UPI003BB68222|nr:hypothetical protein [Vibrio harveyi]
MTDKILDLLSSIPTNEQLETIEPYFDDGTNVDVGLVAPNKKIKSLQLKSLKTLAALLDSSLNVAGIQVLSSKPLLERFQESLMESMSTAIHLHQRFVVDTHSNVVNVRFADNTSYRLSWGVISALYANAQEMKFDASGATELFNDMITCMYTSNPKLDEKKIELGIDGLTAADVEELDARMLKVISTSPFSTPSTFDESVYYSLSCGWAKIADSLHSNPDLFVDGTLRNKVRKLYQEAFTSLFDTFKFKAPNVAIHNMLLKSCITQTAMLLSSIIRIHLADLNKNTPYKTTQLEAKLKSYTHEVLELLTLSVEACTERLLMAENGNLVENIMPSPAYRNSTEYFLILDASLPNFLSSIQRGWQPKDIAQRYIFLQEVSLAAVDRVKRRIGNLTSEELPNDLDRIIYRSLLNVNSILPATTNELHTRKLNSIIDAAVLLLSRKTLSDQQYIAVGFSHTAKKKLETSIDSLAGVLDTDKHNASLNIMLLSSLIEALAETRVFSWGIREGLVSIQVAQQIIDEALSLYWLNPTPESTTNKLKVFETALMQVSAAFSHVWRETTKQTLEHSPNRFCLGDIQLDVANNILGDFRKALSEYCYANHVSSTELYSQLKDSNAMEFVEELNCPQDDPTLEAKL